MRFLTIGAVFALAAGAAVADEGQATWSGFYLGAYGGGARSSDSIGVSIEDQAIGAIDDIAGSGATFGGLAGYNHQMGRVVVGVEAEAGMINVGGDAMGAIMQAPVAASLDYMWTASVRGRARVLATDTLLVYGTAGVAGDYLDGGIEGPFGELSEAKARWGWVAGMGVEWAATDHVRLRLEYLRADLGESDYSIDEATTTMRSVTETVRAAVIYAW
jgi:outer membrane immunogenic protein